MRDNRSTVNLSKRERAGARVLVVEPDDETRKQIVSSLKNLGFGRVSETATHAIAFYKFEGRRFTHLLFTARRATYPVREWLHQIFTISPDLIAIAITDNPSLDDVFSLLMEGSRGFLLKPFSEQTLEYVIALATKCDPLSDKVRQAGEPVSAILAMTMTSLDNVAIMKRQARRYETARRELIYAEESLQRTAELFKLLTKSKQDELLVALERFFVKKSAGPASPLGRLRRRLSESRSYYRE